MKHLTKEQRYQIKAYLNCGKSKAFISEILQVDKSTIYRELKRNSKKEGIIIQILHKNYQKSGKNDFQIIEDLPNL